MATEAESETAQLTVRALDPPYQETPFRTPYFTRPPSSTSNSSALHLPPSSSTLLRNDFFQSDIPGVFEEKQSSIQHFFKFF